ncbi:27 kDa hemolymph protein-like [Chironomus tepperi]|uniref:27 kDa hemolymph protein-like n=1 Tax=Chironomus tepperi TaxID=113505 RepID=UPI00391F0EF8
MDKTKLLLSILYIPCILANSPISPDINGIRDSIKTYLPEGITLPELNSTQIEDGMNKITDALKQKCLEASGSDTAYDDVSAAALTFNECVQDLVDFSNIEEEIEKAKPTGDLDIVFGKYCIKKNPVLKCLDTFANATTVCLNAEEKAFKIVFMRMVTRILDFVCHNNGNQIALFISESGPECFKSKANNLATCFRKNFEKYNIMTFDSPPTFKISRENCADIKKFENCVVSELENCRESTSANLAEAMFRYVKKETVCKNA